jgi:hypothetical protein
MRILTYLIVSALLLSGLEATAQRRFNTSLLLQPELQAERALQGDDYLLLTLRTPLQTGTFDGTTLDRVGVRGAYEHFWNERWSGGAGLRLDGYGNRGTDASNLYVDVRPEAFIRHWNTLGSVNFRQRLSAEYWFWGGANIGRALTHLRLDVDKLIPVGRVVLRPRVAYEAIAYLRLQRSDNELKERVIDFSAARAEVGVRLSPHFDFTPWFGWQTNYANYVPQYDAITGKQTSGGRTNVVTPVIGLDARFTLFSGEPAANRRQLPTQH